MKKLLAVLLALGLTVSFAGCSGEDGEKNVEKKTEASIVGGWEGEVPVGSILREGIMGTLGADSGDSTQQALAEKIAALDYDSLTMKMDLDFDETTMSLTIDRSEAETLVNEFVAMLRTPMEEVLTEMLEAQNVDMTLDELLATQGTSLDEMLKGVTASLDFDDLVMDESSTYTLDGDKLYLGDDAEEYIVVELTDDTLAFSEIVMPDADAEDMAFVEMLTAIEFERVE